MRKKSNYHQRNKGIDGIRITDGYYCRKISYDEYKKFVINNRVFSPMEPYYYLRGNYAYVVPFSTDTTVDLYYMRNPVEMSLNADGYNITINAHGTPSTTEFIGADGQGLSNTNNYYNGSVIYSVEHSSYHVVTFYIGSSRTFTVEPAALGNFTDSQIMRFETHDFDLNVDCELADDIQDIINDRAASYMLDTIPSDIKQARNYMIKSDKILTRSNDKIKQLNEQYAPTDSVKRNRYLSDDYYQTYSDFPVRLNQYIPV